MIFVTVGTHEQPFNRLLEFIDGMVACGEITEEVIVQTGYSDYLPRHCVWQQFFSYQYMNKNIKEARIVITHGGPSSFITLLQNGKIPVVVPRLEKFGEHINDHQLEFCKTMKTRLGNIIVVEDISDLRNIIKNYDNITSSLTGEFRSNNELFNVEFEKIVNNLFKK